MNYLDNVFADFNNGDNQQRLDLFFFLIDLRAEFDKIENEELTPEKEELTASQKIVLNPANTKRQQSPFVKMKRWCFSILS